MGELSTVELSGWVGGELLIVIQYSAYNDDMILRLPYGREIVTADLRGLHCYELRPEAPHHSPPVGPVRGGRCPSGRGAAAR